MLLRNCWYVAGWSHHFPEDGVVARTILRDPTLATTVHQIRNYAAEDIRFGMRYADVVTTAADGAPVLDLTRIGALEQDVGDRREQGWTEREEWSSGLRA